MRPSRGRVAAARGVLRMALRDMRIVRYAVSFYRTLSSTVGDAAGFRLKTQARYGLS